MAREASPATTATVTVDNPMHVETATAHSFVHNKSITCLIGVGVADLASMIQERNKLCEDRVAKLQGIEEEEAEEDAIELSRPAPPGTGAFSGFLLCVGILPLISIVSTGAVATATGRGVCWWGALALAGNYMPVTAGCFCTQVCLTTMTPGSDGVRRAQLSQLALFVAMLAIVYPILYGLPFMFFQHRDWLYICSGIFVLAFTAIIGYAWKYNLPALRRAILTNLNSPKALTDWHHRVMASFACALLAQLALFAMFGLPAITGGGVDVLNGTIARETQSTAGDRSRALVFASFARHTWWLGMWPSVTVGCLPPILLALDASGLFEVIRVTSSTSAFVIIGMVYICTACLAIQIVNMLVFNPVDDRDETCHTALFPHWGSSRTIFITCVTWVQLICMSTATLSLKNLAEMTEKLKGGNQWHFFISHKQANGGDQAAVICGKLRQAGFEVWYDQNAGKLTAEGMQEGVRGSACFILLMTQGVFARPFVLLELQEAIDAGKPIILIHETDARHGAFEFNIKTDVPPEYQPVLNKLLRDNESIGWERRDFKQRAVIQEVKKRLYCALAAVLEDTKKVD